MTPGFPFSPSPRLPVTSLAFLLLTTATAATVLDRVAVTIGHDVITEGEILEDIRIVSFLNQEPPDFSAASRRQAADRLVDQFLIEKEMSADRYQQPSQDEVRQTLDKLVKSRFGSPDAFQQELRRYGITEAELKAHLARQLAVLRFTELRFEGDTPPSTPAQGQAERSVVNTSAPPNHAASSGSSDTVDQHMEQWLKTVRAQTQIVFKKDAFE